MPGWVRPGGVDDPGDLTQPGGRLDQDVQRPARGHVHGGGADLEPGVGQHLGGSVGVGLVQVGHQDLLAGADPPGDGLTDRPGADDNIDLTHGDLLRHSFGCIAPPSSSR
jgi:hypothetical protein